MTLPAGRLSDSTRAALYDGPLLQAGTYRVNDTSVTATLQYSQDSRELGSIFQWTFSMKGDTVDYNIRNDSGRVTSSGRARRVAKRDR